MNFLRTNKVQIIILILINIFVYGKNINNHFSIDDKLVITENNFVKEGYSALSKVITTSYLEGFSEKQKSNLYRPLPIISFIITQEIFGETAKAHHLINILIWCISLLFLFYLLKLMLKEYANDWEIFFIILIYSLLPLNVEPISNIKGRDDLLCLLFALPGIIYFIKSIDSKLFNLKYIIISACCLFLSFVSKETTIIFLIILPTYLYIKHKIDKRRLTELLLISIPFIIVFILRAIFTSNEGIIRLEDNAVLAFDGIQQLYFKLYLVLFYLLKILNPFILSWDYSFGYFEVKSYLFEAVISSCILIGIFIYSLKLLLKKDLISISILWFYSGILLTSNLFFLTGSTFAERFYLIPSIGFFITLFLFLRKTKFYKNKLNIVYIVSPILLIMMFVSYNRVGDWKDSTTLINADFENSNLSYRTEITHYNDYINTTTANNLLDENKKIEIEAKLNELKTKYADIAYLYIQSGSYYEYIQNWDKAIIDFERALELNPNYIKPYRSLGSIYYIKKGNKTLAKKYYLGGLAIDNDPLFYANVAIIYFEENNFKKFEEYYLKALEIDPTNKALSDKYYSLKESLKAKN